MWKLRGSPPAPRRPTTHTAERASGWHAVAIASGRDSCPASLKIAGMRFLSKDAPRLPLPECARASDCGCYYQHHEDRRGDPRREAELHGFHPQGYTGQDRRRLRGRRTTDVQLVDEWKG